MLPTWADAVVDAADAVHRRPGRAGVRAGCRALRRATGPATGFKRLTGDFGLVDLDADPIDVLADLVGVRVFSGYAGWGAGQLEAEIDEGSWYVVEALPTDVLDPDPERLWRTVLRRQPGELAYVATFPDDPAMN